MEHEFKFKFEEQDGPDQIIELHIEESLDMVVPSVEPEFLEIKDCTLISMSEESEDSDKPASDNGMPKKSQISGRCCACRKRKNLIPFPKKNTDYLRYLMWQQRLKVRQPKNRYVCANHFEEKDIIKSSVTTIDGLSGTALPCKLLPKNIRPADKSYFEKLSQLIEIEKKRPKNKAVKKLASSKNLPRESPLDQIRDKYEPAYVNKCPSIVPTILKKISKAEFLQKTKAVNLAVPSIANPNISKSVVSDATLEPLVKPAEQKEKVHVRSLTTECLKRRPSRINGKLTLNQSTQTNLDTKTTNLPRTKRFIDMIKTPLELKGWTGLDGFGTLERLVHLIRLHESKDPSAMQFAMDRTDRVIATLMRMHLNLPMQCIAMMFGIDHKYISKILWPNFLEVRSALEKMQMSASIPKLKDFQDNLNKELMAAEMAEEIINFVPKKSKS